MLTTIRIKNLALVADLTLELQAGYNVITGETGAGKSMIIGALNLVLGERADRTLIRARQRSCSVEAVFDVRRLRGRHAKPFSKRTAWSLAKTNQLVLKRGFTVRGREPAVHQRLAHDARLLAALGEWLVDMHGPHDHQSLLHAGDNWPFSTRSAARTPARDVCRPLSPPRRLQRRRPR